MECIQARSTGTYQPQGTWHLIALTYDGRTVKVYYDGNIACQATGTGGPIFNSTQPVTVARMQNSSDYIYFKGRMDEIALYDFTLTAAQVQSIWTSPNGILPAGTASPVIVYIKN
jgi:hypothetical protein